MYKLNKVLQLPPTNHFLHIIKYLQFSLCPIHTLRVFFTCMACALSLGTLPRKYFCVVFCLFCYFWVADLYLTLILKIGQFMLCAALYDSLQGGNVYKYLLTCWTRTEKNQIHIQPWKHSESFEASHCHLAQPVPQDCCGANADENNFLHRIWPPGGKGGCKFNTCIIINTHEEYLNDICYLNL